MTWHSNLLLNRSALQVCLTSSLKTTSLLVVFFKCINIPLGGKFPVNIQYVVAAYPVWDIDYQPI